MNLRLLATSLAAATLLLSTLGCSKKDEPTVTPTSTTGTGSFKRDGVTITGKATASLGYFNHPNGQTVQDLFIIIVETTPSASDARSLTVEFQDGKLYEMKYKKGQGLGTDAAIYPYTSSAATLSQPTNISSYSGTFSGTGLVTASINTQSTITDGVFTDARL
jgi:hypothetical protein